MNVSELNHLPRLESPKNSRLRDAYSLERARNRKSSGQTLLEGLRLVRDVLEQGVELPEIYLGEELGDQTIRNLLELAHRHGWKGKAFLVAPGILGKLSSQESPEGVAALCRIPQVDDVLVHRQGPILVGCQVQNPGNLGAMVRTASGLGARAFVGVGGCDPYSPKSLRGASGATFRIPVWRTTESEESLLERFLEQDYQVLLAEPRAAKSLEEQLELGPPVALFLGNEAQGLGKFAAHPRLKPVALRLEAGVESLNVAVAAGILLDRILRTGT